MIPGQTQKNTGMDMVVFGRAWYCMLGGRYIKKMLLPASNLDYLLSDIVQGGHTIKSPKAKEETLFFILPIRL